MQLCAMSRLIKEQPGAVLRPVNTHGCIDLKKQCAGKADRWSCIDWLKSSPVIGAGVVVNVFAIDCQMFVNFTM